MYRQVEELLRGMELGVAPPGVLTVMQGQTVRMTVAFSYRGPAKNVTLRCSIGTRILGIFNESVYATKAITLPQSVAFVPYTAFADIVCSVSPSVGYDIEAKISEYTAATLVSIDNVIDVIGAPEFLNFAITDYSIV